MRRNINRPKEYLEQSSSQQEISVQMIKQNPIDSANRIDPIPQNQVKQGSERYNIGALADTESRRMGKSPRSRGISVLSKPKDKKTQKKEDKRPEVKLVSISQPCCFCQEEKSEYRIELQNNNMSINKIQLCARRSIEPLKEKKQEQKQQCQVCFVYYNTKEMKVFGGCGHKYCSICLQRHVKNTINSYKIVKCLDEDCSQQLDISSPNIRSLELPLQEKYYKIRILFNDRKDQDIRVCPSEDCDGFIRLSDENMQCPMCLVSFCKQCLLPRHSGSCDDNGARYLTGKFHYRRCKCGLMVERIEGCQHMTCRCRYQFCYLCGYQWVQNHICPPLPSPIIAPAIPPVQPQVQPPAPRPTVFLSSNQAQSSLLAGCNPCSILKNGILAISFAFLIVLVHVLTFQYAYPIFMCIIVPIMATIFFFFYSLGFGMKEMVQQEKCLAIFLLNIFLLFRYAAPIFLDKTRHFFQFTYCNSSFLALNCLFPISYILYHEMKERML